MPQDYAKNANSKWSKQNMLSQYKNWIILGVTIAISVLFYRYSSIDVSQIKQKVAHTIEKNNQRPAALPKPKFEFYTRLPKGDVTEYRSKIKKHHKAEAKNTTAKPQKQLETQHYLIQVAAFKTLADADKLRAELIMQGFNTNLSHYKNASTTWYRVEIGPFPSLAQAKARQQTLESANYNGLIKKIG